MSSLGISRKWQRTRLKAALRAKADSPRHADGVFRARYAYDCASDVNSPGEASSAPAILQQADHQRPADTDILIALATISRDKGDRDSPIAYARELRRVMPDDPKG